MIEDKLTDFKIKFPPYKTNDFIALHKRFESFLKTALEEQKKYYKELIDECCDDVRNDTEKTQDQTFTRIVECTKKHKIKLSYYERMLIAKAVVGDKK